MTDAIKITILQDLSTFIGAIGAILAYLIVEAAISARRR
jgi:hypothetical protein